MGRDGRKDAEDRNHEAYSSNPGEAVGPEDEKQGDAEDQGGDILNLEVIEQVEEPITTADPPNDGKRSSEDGDPQQ